MASHVASPLVGRTVLGETVRQVALNSGTAGTSRPTGRTVIVVQTKLQSGLIELAGEQLLELCQHLLGVRARGEKLDIGALAGG